MHPELLQSKFGPPLSQASLLSRPRVMEGIIRANGQLVVVSAPAGFGKTTLLGQAFAQMNTQGIPSAWITLDRADNDVSRFLRCLEEAVTRMELVQDSMHSDPVQVMLHSHTPFALFLDEFEWVQEPSVLGLVQELAHRLPRQCMLVIGSRTQPALGLARLRVRGQLIEVGIERLRFDLQDTTNLFRQHPRTAELNAKHLSSLHLKTEGWIAALRLASMALDLSRDPHDFVERFSGSNRAVADYLAEDVLARQTPQVRRFLLRTCSLRQLDVSVCSALNPGEDCSALLLQLESEQLFLTPVIGAQQAWRYHSLFSDYLKAQLHAECPDDVAPLHQAASAWYESVGRPVPAIDHAIEGGDYARATQLLEARIEDFLEQGRMRMLTRWLENIPQSFQRLSPRLSMGAIWATAFTRGPWQSMEMLDALQIDDSTDAYIRSNAANIRPMLLAMLDRIPESMQAGSDALGQLPTGNRFADTALLNAMAHVSMVRGDAREALQLLDAARREHASISTFNRMYTEANEGLLDLQKGRLRQATARLRLAVDATHNVKFRRTHGNAWAGVAYASVIYESNDLDSADHLLNVYLPLARDVGLPDHMIMSHAMRSRIAFLRGEVDVAAQTLTELEYIGHERKLPRVVATAKLERARQLLQQGHSRPAYEELLRADDPEVWSRERQHQMLAHDVEYMTLARLRWEIAAGEATDVLARLDEQIATASTNDRNRRLLVLRLLRALELQRRSDLPGALAQIGQALQFAAQEGFMRLILDEGPAAGLLIQRFKLQYENYQTRSPLLSDYVQRLLYAFGPLPTDIERSADMSSGILEPLTRKELRVLELLVEGYSNGAMAEKLHVSDSTVRTHLRNINMKLDASNRTQAVAIARKFGLVG